MDKKNEEIQERKSNLLALYNHQKNPDFEIEKFKSFVLYQFQGPLAFISLKSIMALPLEDLFDGRWETEG